MTDFNPHDVLLELEWKLCSPDWSTSTNEEKLQGFMHWCSNYVYIRHPERGRILFDLRPAQIDTVEMWLKHDATLALKARQIGFSTLVSVYCLWLTYFYNDREIIMLSKGEREAGALLAHAKYAYRFMVDWMKLRGPMVSMSQAKIVMTNESSMTSMPSASDPARGTTAFTVVVDEIGFLPNSDDAWASIEPVADVGGRIIMLGTANGEGNLFHREWVKSHGFGNGTGRFTSIFHPWSAGDRDQAWYDAKKEQLQEWQLHQEYPSNPDEAFLKSGRPVFDLDALRAIETLQPWARGYLRQGKRGLELVEDGGALRVWETPQKDSLYCIGADVAEGLDYGDYSVAHVLEARTGRVVAKWHGHVAPDLFGSDVLNKLGTWYNDALVGVESNNHGMTTVVALNRTGYMNIFRQRRLGTKKKKQSDSMGWRTTAQSKPVAIDELAKAIRDEDILLVDSETIAELRTFVREGDGKMHGSPHDDRVMSLAITVQMLAYVWLDEYRRKPQPGPGTWGYFLKSVMNDDEPNASRFDSIGLRGKAA